LGTNPKEAALIDQWISFLDTEIDAMLMYLKHVVSRGLFNKAYEADIRGRLTRPLETVETHLANRTFLVGERLTLADISAATVLRTAYSFLLGKAERAKYPHTFHLYETVINQPKIKDILSGGQLTETPQEFVPPVEAPSKEKPQSEAKQEPRSESVEDRPVTKEADGKNVSRSALAVNIPFTLITL
jgi:elongation factor 1-gamma